MTENVTSRSCSMSPKQKSIKLQKRVQSVLGASISPVRYRINDITGRREFDNSNSNSTVAHAEYAMGNPVGINNSSSHKAAQLEQPSDLASDRRELVDEEIYEVDGLKLSVNAQENEEFETDEFEAAEADKGSEVEQISDNEIEEDQQVSIAVNRLAKGLNKTNSKEAGVGNCSPESEVQLSRIINRTDDWQSSPHQGTVQGCEDAEAMQVLESNPGLQNMFMKMIKAGIQEGIKETTASLQGGATKSGELSEKNSDSKGKNTKSKSNPTNIVKSPSDTTLYTPTLQ